jgi:hypothetical protein
MHGCAGVKHATKPWRGVPTARLAACVLLVAVVSPATAQVPADPSVTSLLARADAAWARHDLAAAEQDYEAVLARDPANSRALYRLAHLGTRSARERARLLERYVALEPEDAWGYLALASAQADGGPAQRAMALDTLAHALRLAPLDRDIALARPRLLARMGQDDEAAAAFASWLADHPRDADVARELAEAQQRTGRLRSAADTLQRARELVSRDERLERRLAGVRERLAPAIELGLVVVGETDVTTVGGRAGADFQVGDSSRLAVVVQPRRTDSLDAVARARRIGAQVSLRPRGDVRVTAGGGLTWTVPPAPSQGTQRHLDVGARVRRTGGPAGTSWDVRGDHGPVDVNPEVIRADLQRTQGSAAVDAPIGERLRLRGVARLAALTTDDQTNMRWAFGGGPAVRVWPGVHVGAQWQQVRYREPAASGYFAPRLIEQIEGGIDVDREFDTLSVGLDAGAGWHRFERHEAPLGPWAPAFRVWTYLAWSVQPGVQALIESEAYSTRIAEFVPITTRAERWRYVSATVSLRVALRRHGRRIRPVTTLATPFISR